MKRIVAVITGGASGIGAAVVRQIISDGGCAGIFDLNASLAESLSKDLGQNALPISGSVLVEADLEHARKLVEERFGPVNALVCCAGIPQVPTKVEEFSLSEWTRVLESHLTGTFVACRIIGWRWQGAVKEARS